MPKVRVFSIALFAFVLVGAKQEVPSGGFLHPEAQAAIDGLWSPYCPGLMLEVCTSQGGALLRDSIQRMAQAGMTGDEIIEAWVAEFGEEYRAEPRFSGTGILAWLLPPLVGLLGLGLVLRFVARRRNAPGHETPPRVPTAQESDRLRDALARLDRDEAPDF